MYNNAHTFHDNTPLEKTPLFVSLAQESRHQSVLIEMLQVALQPNPFNKKAELILESLLSLRHLQFGSKGALFLVEQDSSTLALKVAKGFSQCETDICSTVRLGACHCGQTAEHGRATFFNSPPPLLDGVTLSPALPGKWAGNYCVPIVKDGQSYGILALYVDRMHQPSPEMYQLLEAVVHILAIMIENQQMEQQLIHLVNDLRSSIVSLREEKKFSESIIQGLHHGLLVAGLDGRVRKSNTIAQSIFRPITAHLDGQLLKDIVGKAAAAQLLTIVSSDSDQFDRELLITTSKGEKKTLGYTNVYQEDAAGRKIGVIISLADISEVKYVRREMEKMNRLATIAEIASAVAHEVRNPLAGIKIMAQSIEEEAKDNSEQLECSRRIARQVDRLNILLSDFFSYARPAEPNKRPTSLEAVIVETKPLINSRLTKNHIELHVDISSDLPNIIADPHQLQQVFLNLFLNGIDAIRQQGRIDISASLPDSKQLLQYKKKYPALLRNLPYVVVHFTDNGTGMTPATAELVFEPFFTTKTTGAGLGLSIVYRTLKENDAAIVLESIEGKGTTFTIFLRADM